MLLIQKASIVKRAFLITAFIGVAAPTALAGCTEDVACADCGAQAGGGGGSSSSSSGSTSSGASSSSGGVAPGTWTTLITGDWSLAPGGELTSDIHSAIADHDIYVGGIRPIAPLGTHHTVLALGGFNTGNVIYASGVGTNELLFPKGVGFKIPKGENILLQLHVFNTSPEPLSGTSGIEVIEIAPADVEQEADLFLPGPFDFSIPPNQTYTYSGKCTVSQQQTLFAIFPHMHQLGSHFKATVTSGGAEKVIHDGGYQFDHQAFLSIDPVPLSPGDTITTECTWNNNTPQTVKWGESSTAEMCFSILYRYPAIADNGFCM